MEWCRTVKAGVFCNNQFGVAGSGGQESLLSLDTASQAQLSARGTSRHSQHKSLISFHLYIQSSDVEIWRSLQSFDNKFSSHNLRLNLFLELMTAKYFQIGLKQWERWGRKWQCLLVKQNLLSWRLESKHQSKVLTVKMTNLKTTGITTENFSKSPE